MVLMIDRPFVFVVLSSEDVRTRKDHNIPIVPMVMRKSHANSPNGEITLESAAAAVARIA